MTTPLQSLARAIQDTGGGWFQAWTAPEGWRILVYRDKEQLQAGGAAESLEDAIVAALAQMGVTS